MRGLSRFLGTGADAAAGAMSQLCQLRDFVRVKQQMNCHLVLGEDVALRRLLSIGVARVVVTAIHFQQASACGHGITQHDEKDCDAFLHLPPLYVKRLGATAWPSCPLSGQPYTVPEPFCQDVRRFSFLERTLGRCGGERGIRTPGANVGTDDFESD